MLRCVSLWDHAHCVHTACVCVCVCGAKNLTQKLFQARKRCGGVEEGGERGRRTHTHAIRMLLGVAEGCVFQRGGAGKYTDTIALEVELNSTSHKRTGVRFGPVSSTFFVVLVLTGGVKESI